jgi:hypothetical protein
MTILLLDVSLDEQKLNATRHVSLQKLSLVMEPATDRRVLRAGFRSARNIRHHFLTYATRVGATAVRREICK